MKWTGLNELREMFTSFFESKRHLKLESFSLVPQNDNSLLLINSGMAPMKKYFTGEVTPPCKRVTTCQKCIRTPDIERVGITARHGTFFEMLGNFSFGDYFKPEATAWAWEFCTKVLELPVDKIWVSIYEEDDEAFEIWTKNVGVAPDHIVRLGKADNFWEHGAGPCGPCSELYFDRGEAYGCGSPDCKVGCDCDRYIEFWNLVFTQFENDGSNNYSRLDHPNIDTGMGLERLACIMQGVDNLFLVDSVQNIMQHVCRISGVKYGDDAKNDVSLRVITDHIRSVTFLIGDGVMPSNEGRGYVLRRLLRRAARHGRILGIRGTFLSDLCETVIKENQQAYPELAQKQGFIKKMIQVEEENFAKTIDQGLELLNDMIAKADGSVLSGEVAFKLNDTFGFPIDLTKEILSERGMTVDEARFDELLLEQKNKARKARSSAETQAWANDNLSFGGIAPTKFVGYDVLSTQPAVLKIIKGSEFVDSAASGDEVEIVLDETPFYAQGGGQVGDSGVLTLGDARATVIDTVKNTARIYFHRAKILQGIFHVGDKVEACVDAAKRGKVRRNHTAAHLLQAALRKVLGTHVEQAGQLVNENRLRFDFTHFSALTPSELQQIETLINDEILRSDEVVVREMPIAEAKKMGAMALFGEKYGSVVRVVKIGEFSLELCGGTHVNNTAQVGLFKILSESSVASGVRRIEAVTSVGVLRLLHDKATLLDECQQVLKVNQQAKLASECAHLMAELKNKDKTISKLASELAAFEVNNLLGCARDIGGLKVIVSRLDNMETGELKLICDDLKSKFANTVVVLASVGTEKSNIIASVGKTAIENGINAGVLVKEIAQLTGGNGGGRKEMAMAGIKDVSKIDAALDHAYDLINDMLKK